MSVLASFTKQPAEVQDYDIDFSEYLNALGDAASSAVVEVDAGITLMTHILTGSVVKVWLSGGLDGARYKVTARLTTAGGRVKEAEIVVKVKEI